MLGAAHAVNVGLTPDAGGDTVFGRGMVERTIQRQVELFGRPPRQASFDGGFASKENLRLAKDAGVKDLVFHKKCGLKESEMAKSKWVFRKLRKFRAGIEGCISALKRSFKMSKMHLASTTASRS